MTSHQGILVGATITAILFAGCGGEPGQPADHRSGKTDTQAEIEDPVACPAVVQPAPEACPGGVITDVFDARNCSSGFVCVRTDAASYVVGDTITLTVQPLLGGFVYRLSDCGGVTWADQSPDRLCVHQTYTTIAGEAYEYSTTAPAEGELQLNVALEVCSPNRPPEPPSCTGSKLTMPSNIFKVESLEDHCVGIDGEYRKALLDATACRLDAPSQCTTSHDQGLTCAGCKVFINPANIDAVALMMDAQQRYWAKCSQLPPFACARPWCPSGASAECIHDGGYPSEVGYCYAGGPS